jgi:pentatricopeptide repeat protein
MLFEDSQRNGPDIDAVVQIIESLVRHKQWEDAVALLKRTRQEFPISPCLYSQVISLCTDCGQWQEAAALLESMEKDVGKATVSGLSAKGSGPSSATSPTKLQKAVTFVDPVKPSMKAKKASSGTWLLSYNMVVPSITSAAVGALAWVSTQYGLIDFSLREIIFLLTVYGLYSITTIGSKPERRPARA